MAFQTSSLFLAEYDFLEPSSYFFRQLNRMGSRKLTRAEVAEHHSTKSLWVIVKDNGTILVTVVYDITYFLEDHPGGGEILLQFGGKDITKSLQDPLEHVHSDSAYQLLEGYLIGSLEEAEVAESAEKPKFIDPYKPMLQQIYYGNFSKQYYMKHIHIAQHVPFSAPIFGHPFLEVFTKTGMQVVNKSMVCYSNFLGPVYFFYWMAMSTMVCMGYVRIAFCSWNFCMDVY